MKKVLFIMFFGTVLTFSAPAFSYLEVGEKGDAEASAGEQTSNLYRLNANGMLAIKKLKKVDDIIRREQSAGRSMAVSDVNDLLASDAEQQKKKELEQLENDTKKVLSNPKLLKEKDNSAVYAQIKELKSDVRDQEIVKTLRLSLDRRL
ncbi:MAG: hypothetical protein J6Y91_01425 [Alphaproteobacteria bacterium]|nr:hypothetical protein [Alphaproteobacteria bacterium]